MQEKKNSIDIYKKDMDGISSSKMLSAFNTPEMNRVIKNISLFLTIIFLILMIVILSILLSKLTPMIRNINDILTLITPLINNMESTIGEVNATIVTTNTTLAQAQSIMDDMQESPLIVGSSAGINRSNMNIGSDTNTNIIGSENTRYPDSNFGQNTNYNNPTIESATIDPYMTNNSNRRSS